MKTLMQVKRTAFDARKMIFSALYAVALALAIVLGRALETYDALRPFDAASFLLFLILTVVFFFAAYAGFGRFPQAMKRLIKTGAKDAPSDVASNRRYFLKVWGGLTLCQAPVLLAVYPGFFVYDASEELNQMTTRLFTTHHPLLHVLALGVVILSVHKLTGSYNAGIFTYTLLQTVCICAAFAYALTTLRKRGARRAYRIFAFCYFGLFPTVVMYTLCSAKDGLFTAAFLIMTLLLTELSEDATAFLRAPKKTTALIAFATLMMLFRHNGVYAYLVFLPFGIALIDVAQGARRRLAVVLIAPLVAQWIVAAGMTVALHADDHERQEALTVPIMQLTRAYLSEDAAMTASDRELLRTYLPEENLNAYRPRLSDNVKIGFQNDVYDQNPAAFFALWARVGLHDAGTYLNAWALTSYGYWYPFAVINVYEGNRVATFTYEDSSYFGYETEPPGERRSFLPALDAFYRKLSIEWFQQEIPVVSLLFAPSFYFWILLYAAFSLLASSERKTRKRALALAPIFLYWLTCLLGPTYLVRYTLILFEAVVMLPVFMLDCTIDANV